MNPNLHVVLSDWQVPYHDEVAVGLAVGWCAEHQPGTIHLLGDLCDFYALSDHERDPKRINTLQGDIDQTESLLAWLRTECPASRIIYSGGNHEDRLRRRLWKDDKGLVTLQALTVPELLHLDTYGIEWVDYRKPYKIGHLWFFHGNCIRKHSAYSAKGMIEKVGGNVIIGDTHRMGVHHVKTWEKEFAAWENGCLCSLDPDWTIKPNWQQGFSVIQYQDGGLFQVEQIRIINGQYIYHGELVIL